MKKIIIPLILLLAVSVAADDCFLTGEIFFPDSLLDDLECKVGLWIGEGEEFPCVRQNELEAMNIPP